MIAKGEPFALQHKEKVTFDIIVASLGYFVFICDVTSESVRWTLRLAITIFISML